MGHIGIAADTGVTGLMGSTGMVTLITPTGTTNMSGCTGMAGSSPSCEVCGKIFTEYLYLDINFSHEIPEFYRICKPCRKETNKLLKKVKKMEMKQLPLYINDKNIFVKEAVKNRLAGKWLCRL